MAKIFLAVGHGGSDPGTAGFGLREKDVNLEIAKACEGVLKDHGVQVKMSRDQDVNDPVEEEVRECNEFSPDLALAIHNNAGGGDGAEAWYHHGGGKGKALAENVLSEIVKIGQNSRGAKTRKGADGRDYYYFIRETACPAVIAECAFLDHPEDHKAVSTAEGRTAMGKALARGILITLGIPVKDEKRDYEIKPEELKKAGYSRIVISL